MASKRKKLTDEEIVAILQDEAGTAIGAHDGDLARDIERANNFYMGKPYGDEVDGRSQFVTREVLETIEGVMPYMMEVFFGADQVCVFEPEDEDDIEGAKQETEYVNWVFYKSNKGFRIGYEWIKDALLNKIGIVKAVREGRFLPQHKHYENLTPEQVFALADEFSEDDIEDLEIIEDPETGLSDVRFTVVSQESSTVIYNVPPENWRISDGSRCVATARYVGESYEKSISELREMGFEVEDDIASDDSPERFGTVKTSRHEDISDELSRKGPDLSGPSRIVTVWEEYIYLDADGDGLAELLKVIRVGSEILLKQPVDRRPYFAWGPVITPHRFHGLSLAELVMDIQQLKSRFIRNILDNQFLTNNGRYAVVDGQVNLDDLLTSTPHGIVRENFSGAVRELPTPQLGASAFNVLGYVDAMQEKRAGISDRSVGLDPKQFNSHVSATGAELVMTAVERKVALVARIFAETGLKELLLGIHRLGMKFEHPNKKIRTSNGQFIPLNPETWRTRHNMTVTVGIGNGSKQTQMAQMSQIAGTMQMIAQAGFLGSIVTPDNIYNFAMEQTRTLGRKDGALFFTEPGPDAGEQGPSVEEQQLQMQAQVEQQKLELETFEKQAKAQVEMLKLQIEQQKQELEFERVEIEKMRLALEEAKVRNEADFRLMEDTLEQRRLQREQELREREISDRRRESDSRGRGEADS